MAIRQIIPIDDVVKCHANSLDGSPSYESGAFYAAGTLVTYDGEAYTSIVDIEDTDSDTPDAAPTKWALTPNAFRSSGGEGGLSGRVAALEEFDENIPDGYVWLERTSVSGTFENKTFSEILDGLAADLFTAVQALDDDSIIVPSYVVIVGNVQTNIRPYIFDNQAEHGNFVFSAVSSTSGGFIFWSGVAYSDSASSTLHHLTIASDGTIQFTDKGAASAGASRTAGVYYDVYKKIKQS